MRFAPIVSFLVVIALLVVLLVLRPAPQESANTSYALPQMALNPVTSKTPWDQKKLQGKVVLLNFFASWCVPCAAEMPELVALKKKFPHLQIHGIAWNDNPLALEKFLKKNGNPFQAVWLDPKGDATIDLGIRGIPESFLVDGNGMVRHRLSGPLTEQSREALEALITQLQAEVSDAH